MKLSLLIIASLFMSNISLANTDNNHKAYKIDRRQSILITNKNLDNESIKAKIALPVALKEQIDSLTQIQTLLLQVKDNASANKVAPALSLSIITYLKAKITENECKEHLTVLEEHLIEHKYKAQISSLTEAIGPAVEELFEKKKSYKSSKFIRAIYPIVHQKW